MTEDETALADKIEFSPECFGEDPAVEAEAALTFGAERPN